MYEKAPVIQCSFQSMVLDKPYIESKGWASLAISPRWVLFWWTAVPSLLVLTERQKELINTPFASNWNQEENQFHYAKTSTVVGECVHFVFCISEFVHAVLFSLQSPCSVAPVSFCQLDWATQCRPCWRASPQCQAAQAGARSFDHRRSISSTWEVMKQKE